MAWNHMRKRGPEWTQGWTGQALSSISAPPLPLVTVFAIVVFLLSLSQYAAYRELMHHAMFNFKILLFVAPVLLVFLLRSSLLSSVGGIRFRSSPIREAGTFPWGVALVLVALLLLLSYRSSVQSRWFRFGSSD
ncbi:uncharacterized protein LOC125194914 [Salvia hispanica]|uniref:uncharacterized protein LOC125194914 n=1 Tax=Salvia hispanica TaxID=49212 RepID=UPI002009A6B5|nr:uncharacterized protein LOC125194914 [Salvia hispanica]